MEIELLTVQEAAGLLRVHRNTIYAMIHDGRLPAFKVGRVWRIRLADLPMQNVTRQVNIMLGIEDA